MDRSLPIAALLGVVVLSIGSAAPTTASAGPWTPDPGGGYVKGWAHWLPGLAWHAGPEAPEPGLHVIGAYNELGAGTWAELGVVEGFALTAHWMPVRTFLLGDPRSGMAELHASTGEPEVGAKLRVVRHRRFVASLEAAVRTPVGDGRVRQDVYSAAEGNPRVGGLRIDSGVWDVRAGVALGVAWERRYIAASGAVVLRTGGFHTLLLWSAEVGGPLGKKGRWQGRLRAAGQHPLGDGDAPWTDSPSGIGNGTRHFGLTAEAERQLDEHWSAGASVAASMGLAARQVHGPAVTLFAAYRF